MKPTSRCQPNVRSPGAGWPRDWVTAGPELSQAGHHLAPGKGSGRGRLGEPGEPRPGHPRGVRVGGSAVPAAAEEHLRPPVRVLLVAPGVRGLVDADVLQ